MLYNLVKIFKGKEEVVMTDEMSKVNAHKKKLEASQRKGVRGQRVIYKTCTTAVAVKFKKRPSKSWRGYS